MLTAIGLILLWHALSLLAGAYWVPTPAATVLRLIEGTIGGELPAHALYTTMEASAGMVFGAVPAVALAFLLRRHELIAAVIEPFAAAAYGAPKLALAPILIMWFGVGAGSKVALVAISAFFIVYSYSAAGVRALDPRLARMARVAGARERDLARYLVLPAAAPYVFSGLRVALPYSIGGAVVAELLSANRGLGYLIQLSATSFDATGVFAALVGVGLLVLFGTAIVARIERRCLPWRELQPALGSFDVAK